MNLTQRRGPASPISRMGFLRLCRIRIAGPAFVLLAAAVAICSPPAGTRPAHRADSGASILPGGREITPTGQQFLTGPGPFGIAVNASGKIVVTADGGPNRYALTVLNLQADPKVTHIVAHRKRDRDDDKNAVTDDDDADWQSVFMGLAFDGESRLYASEGESGKVRLIDVNSQKRLERFDLNQGGYKDSYTGDLALDADRGLLYVVDQANFRLVIIDINKDSKKRGSMKSIRTGRLPFAVALSPDRKQAYVTNLGMFEYKAIPGADADRAKETGLPFPAFGFPSHESEHGATRQTEHGNVSVPGLGLPNAHGSNSLTVIDVTYPKEAHVVADVPTGLPFNGTLSGKAVLGGSSPSGVVATAEKVFVSNANQDTISVIDWHTHKRDADIELRIPGFDSFRGVLPVGMALTPNSKRLLVAEAGINAIGVIDIEARKVIGHIPTGWFPSAVKASGGTVYVANAKGNGTGPNSDKQAASAHSFQGELRRGTISRFEMPKDLDLPKLTLQAMLNNGFAAALSNQLTGQATAAKEVPLSSEIEHVVIIVKENRTYDEVFGDLPAASNGPREGAPALARWGQKITPNHHALAARFASSDNFYADSEVSVDGHHWLVGSYPNAWTESTLMAAYGGQQFRFPTTAPGRLLFAGSDSSVHPEEQLEAGAIWQHLERHGISFLNFGEGFELAGLKESENLEPTGARFLTNVPMPDPLYRNTSRRYPGFNMNIPDQYRASQFIAEIDQRFVEGRAGLPQLLFIHLPNDHTAKARPASGYPTEASYVADNDLALGRIIEYLSHTKWWPNMAIFVTEDDAQSGVDHVDSHRTLLLVASPYARRNFNSRVNTSFPGLLRTAFRLLQVPPLNLYDATAADLSECFMFPPTPTSPTSSPLTEADLAPYTALPVDPAVFDPAKARIDTKSKGPKMDDPAEIRRQQREQK
jgi:DNA-binding beta-propeller fold protein YncE